MGLIQLTEEDRWNWGERLDFISDVIEKVLEKLEMIDDGSDKDRGDKEA